MNLARRSIVFAAIALICVALSALWAWGWLADQRDAAADSARELAECRAMVQQIQAARQNHPAMPRPANLIGAIAEAAQQASLPSGSIGRIDPDAGQRQADGGQTERQIDLAIQQATLLQITQFARQLSSAPLSLHPTQMKLMPSQDPGGGWAAEMSLTYPISKDQTQ